MLILYLEALVAIALSLWTFSVGLVGAGSALWPIEGAAPNATQWLVAISSLRLGSQLAVRKAGTLEQQMLRSRRERYQDYQSCTSMFFPLPQKGVVT